MTGYRMQQYHVRRMFMVAWVSLVIVIAIGFWIQARTIDRLESDEQRIATLVDDSIANTTRNAEILCGLLVAIEPADRAIIVKTFKDLGYQCTVPVAPAGG